MSKELIVSATTLETKVAILEEDQVTEVFVERAKSRGILGNIYKGRVTKVLPGMQSAFVDIGLERDAFLYVSDFFEDYEEFDKMFTTAEDQVEEALRPDAAREPAAAGEEERRRDRGSRSRLRGGRGRSSRSRLRDEERRDLSRSLGSDVAESGYAGKEPAAPQAPPEVPLQGETGPVGGFDTASDVQAGGDQPRVEWPATAAPAYAPARVDFRDPEKVGPSPSATQNQSADAPEAEPKVAEPVRRSGGELSWLEEVRFAKEELERQRQAAEKREVPVVKPGHADDDSQDSESRVREKPDVDYFAVPVDGEPPEERPERAERTERPERARRRTLRWRHRRSNRNERPDKQSIGDLLREGQEILVQVAKEPIAKKGARITSHIALPGRYIVFMPTVDHIGVSRKIQGDKERARLREMIIRFRGSSKRGFIVRTAGGGHDESDFQQDMTYLTRLWEEIRSKVEKASAPAIVHGELDLVQRLLRDHVSEDFSAIRVDDETVYERVVEFMNKVNPAMVNRVKLYTKSKSIFEEYGINAEIEKALKSKVWLKSGGYIVINQTEALVAIDVNTGKYVGRGDSLEETITKTNLDAVKEVVRQIRLRDLGGIIIIDFIDMDERRNRERVMEALQQELDKDKSPTKILQFNEFGLVALTRKRVKQSLERTLCQPCPYCNGSSMVKSVRTVCYAIHADVKRMVPYLRDGEEILIRCHPDIGKGLREREKDVLGELGEMTGKEITVKSDPMLHFEQYDIVEM